MMGRHGDQFVLYLVETMIQVSYVISFMHSRPSFTIPQQPVSFFYKALEKFPGRRMMLKLAGKPVLGRAIKREKQTSA